jgi:Leucine-rich repeat (LRR) protein
LLGSLHLNSNPLMSLQLEFFQSLPSKLKVLSLRDAKLSELPENAFKNFESLSSLLLSSNRLESFNAEKVGISTNVKELSLNLNNLTKVNFNGVGNLDILYLNDNNLTSFVDVGTFSCATLHLSRNKMVNVSFENIQGLNTVKLIKNFLTSFNADVVGLASCVDLDLSENNITDLNVKNVQNLKKLNMLKNNLTIVALDMFPEEFMLETVNFRNNTIQAIDKNFVEMFEKSEPSWYRGNPCVKTTFTIKTETYKPPNLSLNPFAPANPKGPTLPTPKGGTTQVWIGKESLDQCLKNFEREIARNRLKIVEN